MYGKNTGIYWIEKTLNLLFRICCDCYLGFVVIVIFLLIPLTEHTKVMQNKQLCTVNNYDSETNYEDLNLTSLLLTLSKYLIIEEDKFNNKNSWVLPYYCSKLTKYSLQTVVWGNSSAFKYIFPHVWEDILMLLLLTRGIFSVAAW